MNIPFRLFAITLALLVSADGLLGAEVKESSASMKPGNGNGSNLVNDWLRKEWPAASAWDFGGQFRLRYEDRVNAGAFPNRDFIAHGQDNSNDGLLLRTKIHLGYTPESWITVFAEGRDSRGYFDKRMPSPDDDELDLHQAYFKLGDVKKFPVSLKIGRQEMSYGDERFIGISDWSNTGRVFDAAKLRFENDWLWVDAFAGRVIVPYDRHFNVANDYDWFSGVYASSQRLLPGLETQLYFLSRNVGEPSPNAIAPGLGGPGARDIYTPGLRVRSLPGQFGGWDFGTELAGQFGGIRSGGLRMEHRAFAADVLAGFTWDKAPGKPRLGFEYTYASGDSNPKDQRNETFDLLFGTNHKPYGMMDLFGLRNIHNPSVSFTVKPLKQFSLRADYHLFWLADTHDSLYPESGPARSGNGYGKNPGYNSFVGSELDVVATYQPAAWGELQIGYGHFFAGSYIRQSVGSVPANGGATDADWVYVQMKFSF